MGLTQDELAKRLGYSEKSMVSKIESGKVDLTQSKIVAFSNALGTTPSALTGWNSENETLPPNISVPAARGIPILGTICAGEGVIAEQNYQGMFFVDQSIRADYCLHVHGDSMVGAHIYDGDIAFLEKCYDFEDGKIYGVVFVPEESATLKKVFREDGKLILQPCSTQYRPIIKDPDDVRIVGILVGVYHETRR